MLIAARADNATVTDFRDEGRKPGEAGTPARRHEIARITPRPLLAGENDEPLSSSSLAAAQLRLGVVLPSGRISGRTDQIVHVVPLPPASADPAPLRALCGMPIEPNKADFVTLVAGPPCTHCLLVALEKHPSSRLPQP